MRERRVVVRRANVVLLLLLLRPLVVLAGRPGPSPTRPPVMLGWWLVTVVTVVTVLAERAVLPVRVRERRISRGVGRWPS
jgi:hypothetical protein